MLAYIPSDGMNGGGFRREEKGNRSDRPSVLLLLSSLSPPSADGSRAHWLAPSRPVGRGRHWLSGISPNCRFYLHHSSASILSWEGFNDPTHRPAPRGGW